MSKSRDRRLAGIVVITTLLGAAIGFNLQPHINPEDGRPRVVKWREYQLFHVHCTVGMATLGAIIGIAIDLAVNGRPQRPFIARFSITALLLFVMTCAILLLAVRSYVDMLTIW